MNLKQFAYSLANKVNKHNDFGYVKMLEFDILAANAILARREYEKSGKFPNELITEVRCLGLIEVDAAECCDIELDCKVLRTQYKIPSTISIKDQINFISVSSLLRKSKYQFVNPARIGYTASRFGNFGYYSVLNNYIYIFEEKETEYINLIAAFVDIRELSKIKNCFGVNCFDSSIDVNIPAHYITVIKEMLFPTLGIGTKSPEVEVNKDV